MAIRKENHDDLSHFGNRLWKLMIHRGYDTPKKLATALYDNDLAKVKSKRDRYNSEAEIRNNAIGSIEKKIVKHLHSADMAGVQGELIAAYCKHFGCSADYLFGITDIQTKDPDLRRMCEITGLSEKAILQIASWKKEQDNSSYINECWSALLEDSLAFSIPFDWAAAYQELDEYVKCMAAAEAISEVLKKEVEQSIQYNLVAMKEMPIRKAAEGHYAAYYGMLYKLAQDITKELDSLSYNKLEEDQVYEKELQKMKRYFLNELIKDEEASLDSSEKEDFQFHSHIII